MFSSSSAHSSALEAKVQQQALLTMNAEIPGEPIRVYKEFSYLGRFPWLNHALIAFDVVFGFISLAALFAPFSIFFDLTILPDQFFWRVFAYPFFLASREFQLLYAWSFTYFSIRTYLTIFLLLLFLFIDLYLVKLVARFQLKPYHTRTWAIFASFDRSSVPDLTSTSASLSSLTDTTFEDITSTSESQQGSMQSYLASTRNDFTTALVSFIAELNKKHLNPHALVALRNPSQILRKRVHTLLLLVFLEFPLLALNAWVALQTRSLFFMALSGALFLLLVNSLFGLFQDYSDTFISFPLERGAITLEINSVLFSLEQFFFTILRLLSALLDISGYGLFIHALFAFAILLAIIFSDRSIFTLVPPVTFFAIPFIILYLLFTNNLNTFSPFLVKFGLYQTTSDGDNQIIAPYYLPYSTKPSHFLPELLACVARVNSIPGSSMLAPLFALKKESLKLLEGSIARTPSSSDDSASSLTASKDTPAPDVFRFDAQALNTVLRQIYAFVAKFFLLPLFIILSWILWDAINYEALIITRAKLPYIIGIVALFVALIPLALLATLYFEEFGKVDSKHVYHLITIFPFDSYIRYSLSLQADDLPYVSIDPLLPIVAGSALEKQSTLSKLQLQYQTQFSLKPFIVFNARATRLFSYFILLLLLLVSTLFFGWFTGYDSYLFLQSLRGSSISVWFLLFVYLLPILVNFIFFLQSATLLLSSLPRAYLTVGFSSSVGVSSRFVHSNEDLKSIIVGFYSFYAL